MKKLFDLDSPVMQTINRIGDMILLNLLFILCSLPLLTLGAAWAALYKVNLDLIRNEEGPLLRSYFRAFRENFIQSTALWLLAGLLLAGLGWNFLLVEGFAGRLALTFLTVVVLMVYAFLPPLVVRYRNSLKAHLRNAGVLCLAHLPRTLVMVALNVLPAALVLLDVQLFAQTGIFWLLIGFSCVTALEGALMGKVYRGLES